MYALRAITERMPDGAAAWNVGRQRNLRGGKTNAPIDGPAISRTLRNLAKRELVSFHKATTGEHKGLLLFKLSEVGEALLDDIDSGIIR